MSAAGTPSPGLDLVRVRDDRAGEHVTGARRVGEPRRDEPAGAGLRRGKPEPARPAQVEDELGDRSLVLREEVATEGLAQRVDELVRSRVGARLDDEVDVDLEVPCADRRFHAVAVATRLGERAGDRRLARPVEAEHAAAGRRRPCEHLLEGLALHGRRPQAAKLARRAGHHDVDAPLGGKDEARRGPGDPDDDGALREGRLLGHAWREVGVRTSQPLGDPARHSLDVRLECRVDAQRRTRDACDELDRAIVVGRPEAAGDEANVGFARRAQRSLEISGLVPDDHDLLGLEAQRERLASVERPVAVGSLAAHELAARDDDRRAWAAAHPLTAVAPDTVSPSPGLST